MKLDTLLTPSPSNQQGTHWVILFSDILNEEILLIFHNRYLQSAREEHPNTAIYFGPEIRELKRLNLPPDDLRAFHLWKKGTKGWLLPKDKLINKGTR